MTAVVNTEQIAIKIKPAWPGQVKIYMPFGSYSGKASFIKVYIYPTVVIALVVVLLIILMMKYTKFGRAIYAIGNSSSALMMGINVRRVGS